jgi:hypothetical protein
MKHPNSNPSEERKIWGKNAVKNVPPTAKRKAQRIQYNSKKKNPGYGLIGGNTEVNTSAASERERSKQESRMKNARNHPHCDHMVEDELEVRAALR